MRKIVSNVLVVSSQLIIGGLFLFMLFSGNAEDDKVVVVENNNLNKMADAVAVLFEVDKSVAPQVIDIASEQELKSAEEVAKEEAEKKAREEEEKRKAEEEAQRKAQEEAERIAQEEAARKAEEERAAAAIRASANQSVASLQDYAHNLVINVYGWTEDDFNALVNLWNRESGWNVNCYNSYSGATGIPQALPGNKMASEGDDWQTNGETQIRWGLKYIQGRYGSPSGAWGHFLSHNWY